MRLTAVSSAVEIWLGALPVIAVPMFAVWVVSVIRRDVSVVDVYWGPGFGVAAAWYFLAVDAPGTRGWIVLGAALLWSIRLGLHLGIRWWRKGEEDYRYAAMRAEHGASFVVRSLFTVFGLQAVLIWVLSPVLMAGILAGSEMGALGWIGAGVFLVGWAWEAVADFQLTRFKGDPANQGQVLDSGLWRYSRHPNYFGEAVLWWGLFLLAMDAGAAWTVYVPLAVTLLLLRVSGVPLLEDHLEETRPGYREYVRRTSSFIPWPPRNDGG